MQWCIFFRDIYVYREYEDVINLYVRLVLYYYKKKFYKDFFNFVYYFVKCMCSFVIENCGIFGELEISVLVNKVKMMSYIYFNCYIINRCMIKILYFILDF